MELSIVSPEFGNAVARAALNMAKATGNVLKDLTVFWSGRGTEESATNWAVKNGGKTLATSKFAIGTDATRAETEEASRALAQDAVGNVHVFQGADIPENSIWRNVEYPALMNNRNVTGFTYHILDSTGGETILQVPK